MRRHGSVDGGAIIFILVVVVVLGGVLLLIINQVRNSKQYEEIKLPTTQAKSTGRFEVVEAGVFDDRDAYAGRRKIFLLIDKDNEKEYVGITGVGISEVGTHTVSTGKTTITHPDER
jgi:hypothetical protein